MATSSSPNVHQLIRCKYFQSSVTSSGSSVRMFCSIPGALPSTPGVASSWWSARQIGGEGVSNFPIGVGLMADGNVAIADNHNNFNLTVFSQAGQILWALESKVKHAQCFDVALMKDGSIVLASKDYRLYIYRYTKVPAI